MKTGDLVKYTEDKLRTLERDHTNASVIVYFPKFSYEHTLAHRALEVINESR